MNDWDNLDNLPTDDDDNESFDWLNDDDATSDDDALSWLSDDEDTEDETPQEWQMPRSDRAERAIASQIEDAESADFGDTDEALDWMADDSDDDSGWDLFAEDDEASEEIDDFLVSASTDDSNDDSGWDLFAEDDEASEEIDDFLVSASADYSDDESGWDLFAEDDEASEEIDDFLVSASTDDNDDDSGWDLFAEDDEASEEIDDFLVSASTDDSDWGISDDDEPDLEQVDNTSIWGDLDDDFGEDTTSESTTDNSGWDLADDEFDFTQEDSELIEDPISEQDALDVPDWLSDMPLPEVIEPQATPMALSDDDLGVPDWLDGDEVIDEVDDELDFMSDLDAPVAEFQDDLGVPDWLDGDEVIDEVDDELDFMSDLDAPIAEFQDDLGVPDWLDDAGTLENEPVANNELDDLLGDLVSDESDDDDLGDLLASLDTDDADDSDLDDLLASLEGDDDNLDDLLDTDDADDLDFLEPVSEVDDLDFLEPVSEADDLDFLEPVSEADDLDFLEPVSKADDEIDELELLNQLNNMKTSDLDFMAGITRVQEGIEQGDIDVDELEDDELALLNKLNAMKTSDLDFMEGVTRDEPPLPELDDDELAILNKLSAMSTGDLDFMAGISDDEDSTSYASDISDGGLSVLNDAGAIQTGDLDFMAGISDDEDSTSYASDISDGGLSVLNDAGAIQTGDLDFMAGISDDEDSTSYASDISDGGLSVLNDAGAIQTGDLDFMNDLSQDDGFFQDNDEADLGFFNDLDDGEDVQAWFDSQDEKPATGSLSFLEDESEEIDSQPDWLEQISGIDTDTLREVAETNKKPKPVDIDALIDSFDIEDEVSNDIVSSTDLDSLFDSLDDETKRQLPDDLPADALPDWLQEIAKGTDGASAAALVRQRRDRSLEDLDDRLLELHERGLELSSAPSETEQNTENLSKIVPNIDEALIPARSNFTQAGLITSPNITAEQAQRATLLQGLVGSALGENETESRPIGLNILDAIISRADRIVISLLLIGAVFIPFIYSGFDGIGTLPPGEFAEDSEEFAAFNLVENILPGQYVLLAAEYGATGARELDTATRSFLEHIVTKGGIPVVVSSDAVGLLRAEGIIVDLLGEDTRNESYYIAGFLPGGNIGLRDFAINPNSVLRSDLQGNSTGLSLSSVDDFEAILIISENGETIRNWMEQVASVTETSIIVVTGQSARPLALPYTSSSENTIALLTGYDDAFTYQQMVLGLYNPSPTPTPSPTETETAILISTDLPTTTGLPTDTPMATQAATDIPEPSATPTEGNTAIPSLTPRPATNTPEPEVSDTPIPTATLAPTDEPQSDVELIEIAVVSSETDANVRTGAGTDFSIIGSIATGTQLAIIERSIDEEWIRVVLPDGSSGWIANILLTTLEIPENEFEGMANFSDTVQIGTVFGDSRVNVRSGAGSEFEAVAGLDPNARVRIIGTNEAGDWYNIVLPNGGEGWIASFLLRVSEVPADEWEGASKDGFLPIYFDERAQVQQDDDNDTLLIGRNASGLTMPVYTDSEQSDVLLELANGVEFIVIEEGEPLTQILTESGQIGFIETRIIVTEERARSEVDFAPTPTLVPTITPTMTATATFTPSPFAPQITPAPLMNPESRSSSQAFGLIIAIAIIAFGNLFWIFRWLGQREQ